MRMYLVAVGRTMHLKSRWNFGDGSKNTEGEKWRLCNENVLYVGYFDPATRLAFGCACCTKNNNTLA
jgi:hypothetical protein